MKRLILMRHAKSDWSLSLEDHERGLNKRGMKSAKAMGAWLRAQGWVPDEVLCSSSIRTRETLDLLGFDGVPARFDRALYLADAQGLLRTIHDATGDQVLVLAHNYGIAECANQLVERAVDHPGFRTYPTCATLLAEVEIADWSELQFGMAQARGFAVPREVMATS